MSGSVWHRHESRRQAQSALELLCICVMKSQMARSNRMASKIAAVASDANREDKQ